MSDSQSASKSMFKNIYIDRDHLLEAVVRCMGDGLIAVDNDGRIYLMNPMAEILTGWKSEEVLGKNIAEIYRIVEMGNELPVESSAILKVFEKRQTFSVQNRFQLIRKDDSQVPISETATPIIDERGNLLGAILVFRERNGSDALVDC